MAEEEKKPEADKAEEKKERKLTAYERMGMEDPNIAKNAKRGNVFVPKAPGK